MSSSAVSILSGGAVVTQPRGSRGRGRSLPAGAGRVGGEEGGGSGAGPRQVRGLRCERGSERKERAGGGRREEAEGAAGAAGQDGFPAAG